MDGLWLVAPRAVAHVLSCRIPQVTSALTRQKKEQIVSDITGKLENSVIVFGLRFKGLNVSAAARLRCFQTARATTQQQLAGWHRLVRR